MPSTIGYKIGIYSIKYVVMLHIHTCTRYLAKGWRDAVQNRPTTSTSSCMSLTFHNKIGLTDSMMHGIYGHLPLYILNSTSIMCINYTLFDYIDNTISDNRLLSPIPKMRLSLYNHVGAYTIKLQLTVMASAWTCLRKQHILLNNY